MPGGFYLTLGLLGALVFVTLFAPTVEARRWAARTTAGGILPVAELIA
ncbi:hypothetical protein [Nocardia sp. CC227C]|nr:hypothetical protein [Nocardia sp. CC227C]